MPMVICAACGLETEKETSAINCAKRKGLNLYCDKKCAGIGRRKNKTLAQKKEEKRLYDIDYRERNKQLLKDKKADYFKRTYDPVKAAIDRKKTMDRHIQYCRRPEYKQYKKHYDRWRRANQLYGEFWESFLALQDVESEVFDRASRYEIYLANGTLNKSLRRKREYERINRIKS